MVTIYLEFSMILLKSVAMTIEPCSGCPLEPIKAKQHLLALDDQILAVARLKIKQQEHMVGAKS